MDDKHKNLIGLHRSKFVQCVDVKRLMPFLQGNEVLSETDVDAIIRQPSRGCKVEKLLDILQNKGNQAFQTLCLALETTYPHLVTVMFLGVNNRAISCIGLYFTIYFSNFNLGTGYSTGMVSVA